jgi:hypothetical protein
MTERDCLPDPPFDSLMSTVLPVSAWYFAANALPISA